MTIACLTGPTMAACGVGDELRRVGWKGARGMGGAEGTGVLRCAQDDSKNKQRQEQTTPRTNNTKNKQHQEQTTARTNNSKNKQQQEQTTPRTNNTKNKQ